MLRRLVRRTISPVSAGAVALATVLALAAPATASVRARLAWAPAMATPTAMIRIGHFSPDESYVDVYAVSLNRRQFFPNVFYKTVSAYWPVAAGPFTYEVRPAGATPSDPPALRVSAALTPGHSYTVAAYGHKGALRGLLLDDTFTPASPGQGKLRVLDTLLDDGPLDVLLGPGGGLGGQALASGVMLGTATPYRQLPAGTYPVAVRHAGNAGGGAGSGVLGHGTVAVRAGTVTTLAVVGGGGQPDGLVPFADAAGSAAMPRGGVATGAGGSARAFAGAVPLLPARLAPPGSAAPALQQAVPQQAVTRLPCSPDCAPGLGRWSGLGGLGFEVDRLPTALTSPAAGAGTRGAARPVRLRIAAIGVDTPLDPLGLAADGSLQVPADFGRAGWFTSGALPGAPGPAVIAGHVDSVSGPAAFYRLRQLVPGDAIVVRRADGAALRFVVEGVRQYPKMSFPAAAVFGPVSWPALRLVTCGGSFDGARHSYRDNLVVDARLVPSPSA